jgi:hypothetical protein
MSFRGRWIEARSRSFFENFVPDWNGGMVQRGNSPNEDRTHRISHFGVPLSTDCLEIAYHVLSNRTCRARAARGKHFMATDVAQALRVTQQSGYDSRKADCQLDAQKPKCVRAG